MQRVDFGTFLAQYKMVETCVLIFFSAATEILQNMPHVKVRFFFLWLGSRFNAIVFSVMTENVWGFRLQESHICIVRFSLVVTLVKAIYNQKQQKML